LPEKVIKTLTETLGQNITEDNMKKHITLILFYAFRNGQDINSQTLITMNKLLKHRISACNALGYYIDRYGVKDFKNLDMLSNNLKKIIQESDLELKKAATFTINNVIKHQENKSIEDLED
jgi:hypothetical protein